MDLVYYEHKYEVTEIGEHLVIQLQDGKLCLIYVNAPDDVYMVDLDDMDAVNAYIANPTLQKDPIHEENEPKYTKKTTKSRKKSK